MTDTYKDLRVIYRAMGSCDAANTVANEEWSARRRWLEQTRARMEELRKKLDV